MVKKKKEYKKGEEEEEEETQDMEVEVVKTGITHTLQVTACPIETVTVYRDRAEITRKVEVTVDKTGIQDLILSGISQQVDQNSIRVSGGRGEAVILEVSFGEKYFERGEDNEEMKALRDRLEKLKVEEKSLLQKKVRLENQKEWLKEYGSSKRSEKSEKTLPLDEASQFLQFYEESMSKLDQQSLQLEQQIEELKKTINDLTLQTRNKRAPKGELRREVTVSLNCTATGKIVIQVSYVAMRASWKSSYDVRVLEREDKQVCQLTYYGMISNSTGEDWNDVSIALSTAVPSLGGKPPKLPTAKVVFEEQHLPISAKRERKLSLIKEEALDDMITSKMAAAPPVQVLTTKVEEGSGSLTYEIPRQATIASDGKPHKVTIVVLDLDTAISYYTVPSLSLHVYTKAIAKNNSSYQLLAGTMNVFFNNYFVSQSNLEHVNPSEDIELWLGVDSRIKADLKPTEQKDGSGGGLIKRNNLKDTKISIWLQNSKKDPVDVTVMEQLPLSTDERIKVRLLEPDVKQNDPDTYLDEHSNIVRKVQVIPGKKVTLKYHYTLEYPQEKKIVIMQEN